MIRHHHHRRIIFLQAAQDRKGVRLNKDKDVEKNWVRMESPSFMQRGQCDFFVFFFFRMQNKILGLTIPDIGI